METSSIATEDKRAQATLAKGAMINQQIEVNDMDKTQSSYQSSQHNSEKSRIESQRETIQGKDESHIHEGSVYKNDDFTAQSDAALSMVEDSDISDLKKQVK